MKLKLLFLFVAISLTAFSQSYTIDLSKNINDTYKKTINSKTDFKISVINKIPKEKYNVIITKKAIPIELFSLKAVKRKQDSSGGVKFLNTCILINEVNRIDTIQKEEDLAQITKSIEKKLKEIKPDKESCSETKIEEVKSKIDSTKDEIWKGSLKKGEQLEVVISRKVNDETRKWTYIYSTEPRGQWQISYGFSFITEGFNKEDLYYAKQTDTVYTITKDFNRKSMSFAPSIFFTWMPSRYLNEDLGIGVSGGLGFDFESPTVFLSCTFSYNQNLRLHLGLVAHKQNVLLGKYEEGQIINENLSKEQLHEDLYRLNPFISLSFRFDQNPFSRSQN